MTLLVEPLNIVKDHVGYYLWDSNEAFSIIREVDAPCMKVLYDVYHRLHMQEPVTERIQENLDLIGHFHAAGWPDRDDRLFEGYDHTEPVFITKNGQGDLAVMSIEAYEALYGRIDLYRLLDEGRMAVNAGKKRPLHEVMKDIKRGIADGDI